MLKKVIGLNVDDLLLYLFGEISVFLLTQIITGIIMVVSRPWDGILISGVTLPISAGILVIIAGIGHVAISFEQALRFGQTRRRALGLAVGLMSFQAVVALALAALLALVERYLCPPLWAALMGSGRWVVDYPGDWGGTGGLSGSQLLPPGLVVVSRHFADCRGRGADHRGGDSAVRDQRRLGHLGSVDGGLFWPPAFWSPGPCHWGLEPVYGHSRGGPGGWLVNLVALVPAPCGDQILGLRIQGGGAGCLPEATINCKP